MSLPIAIQLYSVRDEAGENLFETLKEIKEMGYDGVEFAGLHDKSAEEIRDFCDQIGLTPISAHVPLKALLADTDKELDTYKTLGCQYIAIPYISGGRANCKKS